MTIPYDTDEDLHDREKCSLPQNEDKTPVHENKTYEQKNDTDCIIIPYLPLIQRTESDLVYKYRGSHDQYLLKKSLITLLVFIIFILKSFQNVTESSIQDSKVHQLFHRVKIKINMTTCMEIKALNTKYSKSEWIFDTFIRPFQKIPQYVFQTYPFLPQDYNSLCQNEQKRHIRDAMNFEGARLATFSTFPASAGVYATRLASAGFYYAGNGDEVVCFSCGIKYNNWQRHDSPKEIHQRISPNCSFVQDTITEHLKETESRTATENHFAGACGTTRDIIEADNKQFKYNNKEAENYTGTSSSFYDNESPKQNLNFKTDPSFPFQATISKESLPAVTAQSNAYSNTNDIKSDTVPTISSFPINDTQSLIRIPQRSISKPPFTSDTTRNTVNQKSSRPLTNNENRTSLESLGMGVCVDKPKYPKYAIRTSRLDSFQNWPKHLTQSPEEMALAGFFFTGIEDNCRCFFCGGGLKNWEHDDQPWIEHARWYQNCAFVRQCKGDKFVENVQANKYSSVPPQPKNEDMLRPPIKSDSLMIKNEYQNHPAVLSVSEFGYDSDLVKKAYDSLQNAGTTEITGTTLLEAIFQLEESTNQSEKSAEARSTKSSDTQDLKSNIGKETTVDPELELSIKSLEEENQNLRDQQTCKICLDEQVAIVFLPCGHMASCVNCASALRRCPICRTFIKGTVKAIMC